MENNICIYDEIEFFKKVNKKIFENEMKLNIIQEYTRNIIEELNKKNTNNKYQNNENIIFDKYNNNYNVEIYKIDNDDKKIKYYKNKLYYMSINDVDYYCIIIINNNLHIIYLNYPISIIDKKKDDIYKLYYNKYNNYTNINKKLKQKYKNNLINNKMEDEDKNDYFYIRNFITLKFFNNIKKILDEEDIDIIDDINEDNEEDEEDNNIIDDINGDNEENEENNNIIEDINGDNGDNEENEENNDIIRNIKYNIEYKMNKDKDKKKLIENIKKINKKIILIKYNDIDKEDIIKILYDYKYILSNINNKIYNNYITNNNYVMFIYNENIKKNYKYNINNIYNFIIKYYKNKMELKIKLDYNKIKLDNKFGYINYKVTYENKDNKNYIIYNLLDNKIPNNIKDNNLYNNLITYNITKYNNFCIPDMNYIILLEYKIFNSILNGNRQNLYKHLTIYNIDKNKYINILIYIDDYIFNNFVNNDINNKHIKEIINIYNNVITKIKIGISEYNKNIKTIINYDNKILNNIYSYILFFNSILKNLYDRLYNTNKNINFENIILKSNSINDMLQIIIKKYNINMNDNNNSYYFKNIYDNLNLNIININNSIFGAGQIIFDLKDIYQISQIKNYNDMIQSIIFRYANKKFNEFGFKIGCYGVDKKEIILDNNIINPIINYHNNINYV